MAHLRSWKRGVNQDSSGHVRVNVVITYLADDHMRARQVFRFLQGQRSGVEPMRIPRSIRANLTRLPRLSLVALAFSVASTATT